MCLKEWRQRARQNWTDQYGLRNGCFQIAIDSIQTLPSDFYSGQSVGSLAGVGGTAAVVGVMIMNFVIPFVTGPETDPNWMPAFVIGALLVCHSPYCPCGCLPGKVEPVTPSRP